MKMLLPLNWTKPHLSLFKGLCSTSELLVGEKISTISDVFGDSRELLLKSLWCVELPIELFDDEHLDDIGLVVSIFDFTSWRFGNGLLTENLKDYVKRIFSLTYLECA